MSDAELKEKMFKGDKETYESQAASIAAFCLVHHIPLERGMEIAIDIIGDQILVLLKSGAYDKVEKRLEETERVAIEVLDRLQAKMREDFDE